MNTTITNQPAFAPVSTYDFGQAMDRAQYLTSRGFEWQMTSMDMGDAGVWYIVAAKTIEVETVETQPTKENVYYATESTLTDMTSTIHARKENKGKTLCGRNATFNYLVSGHYAATSMQWAQMRADKMDTSETEIVSCMMCERAMLKETAKAS